MKVISPLRSSSVYPARPAEEMFDQGYFAHCFLPPHHRKMPVNRPQLLSFAELLK